MSPILPSNQNLRSDLFALRIIREQSYGIVNKNVTNFGEFLGLVEDFAPPDSSHQFTTHYGVRPATFGPVNGIIDSNFNGGGWGNAFTAAYPAAEVLEGSINNAYLTSGLILLYVLGDTTNTVSGNRIQHTISERIVIPSFTMEAAYYNTSGNQANSLRLMYTGCKINSLSIEGQEGKPLTYSAAIAARDAIHNIAEVANNANERTWLGFDTDLQSVEANNPLDLNFTQDIYNFSGGRLEIFEPSSSNQPSGPLQNSTYARMQSFRLTINNNLQPQFYINNLDTYGTPLVSELLEGNRQYTLEVNLHPDDQDVYRLLMQLGYYGAERRGYGIRIRFDRPLASGFAGDEYLEFRMPASTRSITNRNWSGIFSYSQGNVVGPISGFESNNPNIGCFLISAPHNRSLSAPLIQTPLQFIVPSLECYVQDNTSYGAIQ